MRLNRLSRIVLTISIAWNTCCLTSFAQNDEDYYMFPIRPGEINTLAGTMGELRTTHFHAGLDIRTGGRTGLPVYAAADGYVSRAAVKSGGYGNALYITHLNGETTVYGHLESFNGSVADHILGYQYRNRKLFFNKYYKKSQFSIKKGDVIGYSGNSGSSAGPHLHFEIRDNKQQVLNPLKYHFEEVRDTTAPIFKKLAIVSPSNSEKQRQIYNIKQNSNTYYLDDTITTDTPVQFELLAYDKLDDANYKCGISEITFSVNNKLVFRQRIDTINFSEQRNILAHYNYPAYRATGEKYHKLYVGEGNNLKYYTVNTQNGAVLVNPNDTQLAVINIIDVLGNKSDLKFYITGNKKTTFSPSYGHAVTLKNDTTATLVPPNANFIYYGQQADVKFGTESLFDSIYFQYNYYFDKNEVFSIGDPDLFPLRTRISITLKTAQNYIDSVKDKTHVYKIDNGITSYYGGTWVESNISFKTREFGEYTILTDSIAPTIQPVSITSEKIKFRIKDNLSGINKFDAYINNEWVLMHYDYKTALIWSKRKSELPLTGDLTLRVFDNAGNLKIYKTKIE